MSADRDRDAFFTLHADLPREGPGETADVAWAAEVAGLARGARLLDAACGPGGDIGALLRAAPEGHVTAIDLHAPFIDHAKSRWGADRRVTLEVGDMTDPEGPFDLIWCAGAVYFLGIEAALSAWRGRLAPGGAIAFSEPVYLVETPSDGAVAFWAEEGLAIGTASTIAARVASAGYATLATRVLSDVAWEGYFRPLEDRIARLRSRADARLAAALDAGLAEIAAWRAHRRETGYLLSVVRPT
jgi:SAM-dependent methyltransferase